VKHRQTNAFCLDFPNSLYRAFQASQVSIMEDHEIVYPSLRQALKANWTGLPNVKKVNPVFYALQAMYAVHDDTGNFAYVRMHVYEVAYVFVRIRVYTGICLQILP
jgi:hypothetical protein